MSIRLDSHPKSGIPWLQILTFFLLIRIEIILLFEIQFLNTAIFRQTLFSWEMAPVN